MNGQGKLRRVNSVLEFNNGHVQGVLTQPDSDTEALALLLHGGPSGTKSGPSDLYIHLSESLASAGIASARFDFFGEGESDGDYVSTSPSHQLEQYRVFMDWLKGRGFTRIGVVGESFGGTCALSGYDSNEVQALVLLYPAIWLLDRCFESLIAAERREELAKNGYLEMDGVRVGQKFIDELINESDREDCLRRVTAPTLLVHGDADSEVPVHQSHKAFDILSEPKRLVIVPRADHCLRRPDEQAIAVEETVNWLKAYLLD